MGFKARGLRSPTRDRDDLEEEGTGAETPQQNPAPTGEDWLNTGKDEVLSTPRLGRFTPFLSEPQRLCDYRPNHYEYRPAFRLSC